MNAWPIIGHESTVRQLQQAVDRDELAHAILITGPDGVGKMTLALALASALFCRAPVSEHPCGECATCRRVANQNYTDLLIIAPEEERGNLKIEQIRVLERFLALTPSESRYKLAVIAHFENATPGAANALLKTLEEPPAYAHLILLATDADLLLPTIVSRSQQLGLRPLPRDTVQAALAARWEVPEAQAAQLASWSGGRLGWAVRVGRDPELRSQMERAMETLLELLSQDLPARFGVAADLAKDPVRLLEWLEYWQAGWRDILLLQTAPSTGLTYLERREPLMEIAHREPIVTTLRVLQALEAALEALRHNANAQLVVETLVLEMPEVQR